MMSTVVPESLEIDLNGMTPGVTEEEVQDIDVIPSPDYLSYFRLGMDGVYSGDYNWFQLLYC